jgi:hypothetical protein
MYKLVPVLVLTAVAGAAIPVHVAAAQRLMAPLLRPSAADTVVPQAALVLVGGMRGGGMGGGAMTGGMGGGAVTGGMGGGAATGGMSSGMFGGMGGGGIGGMTSGGYQWNGSSYASGGGRQQYYQCIAQHGQCTVTSAPGSLRRGASCTCLFGGPGKIR